MAGGAGGSLSLEGGHPCFMRKRERHKEESHGVRSRQPGSQRWAKRLREGGKREAERKEDGKRQKQRDTEKADTEDRH